MKKRIGIFMIALCMCLQVLCPHVTVFAASGKTSVSASASSVNIGDTVTVTGNASGPSGEKVLTTMTLSWDAGVLQFVSCSVDSNGGGGSRMVNGDSFTITLKAISAGTSSISLSATDGVLFDTVESLDSMAGSSTSVTVNNEAGQDITGGEAAGGNTDSDITGGAIGGDTAGGNTDNAVTGGAVQDGNAGAGQTLSGDNSLKSLTISPGTLSPSFSAGRTSYTAAVGSDVTSIAVSAIPANAGAAVEAVTGNENLKEGTNTIQIVVRAENGVTAAYTIKVTKQAAGGSEPEETKPAETETENETEAPSSDGREGIIVNGAAYQIAEDFAEEDIPADFMKGTIHYHQNTYAGASFTKGLLNLLWMIPQGEADAQEAKGRFFIYDETRDSVYPFVKFTNGEKYVIALSAPVDFTMPDNYQQTSLALDEENVITAYQRLSEDESEIESEFYVFYGVNHEGTEGWYQYDTLEGTYQRLSVKMADANTAESQDALAALQADYHTLLQQYEDEKAASKTAFFVLLCVMAAFLVIIINLVVYRFRNRGNSDFMEDDLAEDDFMEDDFAQDDFGEDNFSDAASEEAFLDKNSSDADTAEEMKLGLDIAMRDRFGNDGEVHRKRRLFGGADSRTHAKPADDIEDRLQEEAEADTAMRDEVFENTKDHLQEEEEKTLEPLAKEEAAEKSEEELEVIDFNDL